jgi:hypothetical protein
MPVIGAISGGLDFSNYYLPLSAKVQSGLSYADAKKQGAVLGWGHATCKRKCKRCPQRRPNITDLRMIQIPGHREPATMSAPTVMGLENS